MSRSFDTEPAEFIRMDLFPAYVEEDGQFLGEVFRAIVTNNYFYLMHEGLDGPYFKIKEPLVDFEGDSAKGYIVETEEKTYNIKRSNNCGCGSRLKGYYPFPGIPFQAQIR